MNVSFLYLRDASSFLFSIEQREIFFDDTLHEKSVNIYREQNLQLILAYSTKLCRIIQDTLYYCISEPILVSLRHTSSLFSGDKE